MVYIRLKEYLKELEKVESLKEGIRLQVPTIADISRDANIHYTTMNRIANQRARRLDFNTAEKIIRSVRRRGFDMQMSDLITFREKQVVKVVG